MWPRRRNTAVTDSPPLRIVGDGMMATAKVGDGRMIPVLIVNTADRPDIEHLVRAHSSLPPGDVESAWGELIGAKGYVGVILKFLRPVRCDAIIAFECMHQGILVDMTLQAGMFYLQPGRPGDKLSQTLDHPRIVVEIYGDGFRGPWNKIYLRAMTKRAQAQGLTRKEADAAARAMISKSREVLQRRMKDAESDQPDSGPDSTDASSA